MTKTVTEQLTDVQSIRTLHLNVHRIVEKNGKYFVVSSRENKEIKTLKNLFDYFE